jgi:hypothetical protein
MYLLALTAETLVRVLPLAASRIGIIYRAALRDF